MVMRNFNLGRLRRGRGEREPARFEDHRAGLPGQVTHQQGATIMNDTVPAVERRAQALMEISKMQADLIASQDENAKLKHEIDHLNDRVAMLIEDRDLHRGDAKIYQKKLIELATSMANIGLLTRTAEAIMATVQELEGSRETEQQAAAEQRSAAEMVRGLPMTIEHTGSPNGHARPLSANEKAVEAALAN